MENPPRFERSYRIGNKDVHVRVEVYQDEYHCYKARIFHCLEKYGKSAAKVQAETSSEPDTRRHFELTLNGPGTSKLEKKLIVELHRIYSVPERLP